MRVPWAWRRGAARRRVTVNAVMIRVVDLRFMLSLWGRAGWLGLVSSLGRGSGRNNNRIWSFSVNLG